MIILEKHLQAEFHSESWWLLPAYYFFYVRDGLCLDGELRLYCPHFYFVLPWSTIMSSEFTGNSFSPVFLARALNTSRNFPYSKWAPKHLFIYSFNFLRSWKVPVIELPAVYVSSLVSIYLVWGSVNITVKNFKWIIFCLLSLHSTFRSRAGAAGSLHS